MPIQEVEKIWMNGNLVDWKDAKIHVLTHALHYGSAVFEGIRCYKTADGPAVFRLKEHIARLFESGKIYFMDMPFSKEELRAGTKDMLKATCEIMMVVKPNFMIHKAVFYNHIMMSVVTFMDRKFAG